MTEIVFHSGILSLGVNYRQLMGAFWASSTPWSSGNYFVYLNGTVYCRKSGKRINEADLLSIYLEYGNEITQKIKGVYIIVISSPVRTIIFNDHLGIRKLFYSKINQQYLFSTNFWELKSQLPSISVSKAAIALHALTNHFVGGKTIVNEISYCLPSCIIEIKPNGNVLFSNYWDLSELLKIGSSNLSINSFANEFASICSRYLLNSKNATPKLTLTGGLDSRLILASLFYKKVSPFVFTYGFSSSNDVRVAKKIALQFNLPFYNPQKPNLTREWFEDKSKTIKKTGNGLAHFHRAYRWDGIEKALKWQNDSKLLFAGFLGGEGIRGAHFDNLVISNFVQNWRQNGNPELIKKHLEIGFINTAEIDINDIAHELSKLPYFSSNLKHNEFYLLFHLNASNHLAQDINYYIDLGEELILPFMDIDYLQLLFSSRFNMLYKNNTSHNQLKRLNIPDFHCKLLKALSPSLTKIILTNGYKPSEYLMGKIPYVLFKGARSVFSKPRQSNFSYGPWFNEYIENCSKNIGVNSAFFNVKSLEEGLKGYNATTETEWQRFTSVYMISDFITDIQ